MFMNVQNLGDTDVVIRSSGGTVLATVPAGIGQTINSPSFPYNETIDFGGAGNGTHILLVAVFAN